MAEIVKLNDYLQDFIPSLENFCSKSPLQLVVRVIQETGEVFLTSIYDKKIEYIFKIDPLKEKKSQIKEIKTYFEKMYPIIFDYKRLSLSKEKQEELIESGKPVREVLDMREDVFLPRYKILRVHNKYNEIDVFDFKTKKMVKFKILIPLISFLSFIFDGGDKISMYNLFREKTKFMYIIRNNNKHTQDKL